MSSAGSFNKEIDLSLYTEISSNLTVGCVHLFSKGPVNEKTLISNPNKLEEVFGRPIDSDVFSQGFFALQEYLRNGNQAWVVRAESSANTASYAQAAIRGATNDQVVTGDDGVTSSAATRTLTSSGASFITAGVLVGDVLEVAEGSDAGFYVLTNVAATVLTVDRDWPAGSQSSLDYIVHSAKREAGTNGVTSVPSLRQFTSSGSTFLTNGVAAGDVLYINDDTDTDDNGFYVIETVVSETSLKLNRDLPVGSLTGLTFTVYGGNHPSKADGATATAGEFFSTSAKFQAHGVGAGDILVIEDTSSPGNNGTYMITGRKTGNESTTLLVNAKTWPGGSLSSLTYKIYPGSIYAAGESKGSWGNGYQLKTSINSVDSTKFDLTVYNLGNFVAEKTNALTLSTVAATVLEQAAFFPTVTVATNRLGPALDYTATVSGGTDGTSGLVDGDLIGTGSLGLQQLRNVDEVELDVLIIPGYSASQNVGDALLAMAATRGDCVAIIDPPDFPDIRKPQEAYQWHNGQDEGGLRTHALNSSYGACYWPWLKTYDKYWDKSRWIAPSGHVAGVWAQSENATHPWFAPAGIKRGLVPGATDLRYNPDQGERDLLNDQGNINPITKFIKEGITVFGQKTLSRATTALNRINVRRMMLFVERSVIKASRQINFEPADETTMRDFVRLVKPLFEYVQANRGLRDFLVVCDKTVNTDLVLEQNKLIARMFMKPTKTAEVIELQYVLTAQNASFQELLVG